MAGKAFQWAWRGKLCSGHRLIICFTGIPTTDHDHGIGRFALDYSGVHGAGTGANPDDLKVGGF